MALKGGLNSRLRTGFFLTLNKRRIDYRTRVGRGVLHLKRCLINDLGGEDEVKTAEMILIERIAIKCAIVHFQEQALIRGEVPDYREYVSITNSLRSDLLAIGLRGREKDLTVTLNDYLKQDKE
jgi:hypothetical protein